MVKVCHMTSAHGRYDVRIVQKECISLVNAGYNVYLIVCDEKQDEEYQGVHIISTNFKPKSRRERFWRAGKKVYDLAVNVDAEIYCFHDPDLLKYAFSLHKKGKKVIFDSHEFYAFQILTREYIPNILRKCIAKGYQLFEQYCLHYVDAVLVPCMIDGKNYFEQKAKRTEYIANVPKLNEFHENDSENNEKEELICHVGSLSYERGIWHLVKSMKYIEARLALGGNFSVTSFEEELKKLDEYKKVDFLGFLRRNEVEKLYKKAKVGICTILNTGQYDHIDTMATKVYEYMLMGVPVVLSDTPYTRKVLKEYPFGIAVMPDNPREIADAVNYLLANPKQAARMGEIGRETVKKVFNWEKEEQKLLHLYRSL